MAVAWNALTLRSKGQKVKVISLSLSLSPVFCCRAGSGYPNGYPVLGNSQGGFPLPSLRLSIALLVRVCMSIGLLMFSACVVEGVGDAAEGDAEAVGHVPRTSD